MMNPAKSHRILQSWKGDTNDRQNNDSNMIRMDSLLDDNHDYSQCNYPDVVMEESGCLFRQHGDTQVDNHDKNVVGDERYRCTGQLYSLEEDCSLVSSFDKETDAWAFVEEVHKLSRNLTAFFPNAEVFPVAVDDMVHCVERMLEEQWTFIGDGKPALVDVGYHYTNEENIGSIAAHGLMTSRDRDSTGIRSKSYHGRLFGDAIYTGNNPFAFSASYGSLGLIVARLKGRQAIHLWSDDEDAKIDTYTSEPGHTQKVALRRSNLCVPLIRFNRNLVDIGNDDSSGNILLYFYHVWLQKIIDDFFHGGAATEVNIPLASHVLHEMCRGSDFAMHRMREKAHEQRCQDNMILTHLSFPLQAKYPGLQNATAEQYMLYLAPDKLEENVVSIEVPDASCQEQPCALCNLPLSYDYRVVARLSKCQHRFHYSCFKNLGDKRIKCPVCQTSVFDPQGTSPPASMTIYHASNIACHGYSKGSYCIAYHAPCGVQQSYHPSPGQLYDTADFVAFLPDNIQGQKTLQRLKYAFLRGLTFKISSSSSIFLCAQEVIWSQIPHKTRPCGGGMNGFPDPDYLMRCNSVLDELGVPVEP